MISILSAGTLIKKATERISQGSGRKFVTGQIRSSGDGESFIVSIIAFNADACKALLALDAGDSLCIAGTGKPTTWTGRDGDPAYGLSVVAQQVMTQYRLTAKRKAADSSKDFLPVAQTSMASTLLDGDGTAPF